MNVITQVCAKKQAEKLKKLGLLQTSLLYHYYSPAFDHKCSPAFIGDGWAVGTAKDALVFGVEIGLSEGQQFSAYNTAELGAMLLKETKYCWYHNPSGMWSHDNATNPGLFETQAQCYADRLIWRMGIEPLKWTPYFVNNRLLKFLGE